VFNALRPDELLVGVGQVLRLVAAAPGPLEEYERSQALSAYSVTRLLAAEERAMGGLLAETKHALVDAIAGDERPAVRELTGRVSEAANGPELGQAVSALLALLAPGEPLRARTHGILATMIDAEVAALADVTR
jgi:diphthamide biosynthesis methyltransferase